MVQAIEVDDEVKRTASQGQRLAKCLYQRDVSSLLTGAGELSRVGIEPDR